MIRRRAFTLVELVASMAIMVILLLAMASALTFSIRATGGQGVTNQTNLLTAADAADQISDDLNVATNFSECTGTSIAFTVPDRVSNGTPNQIRYAWSGTSGAALTRQFCASATPTLTASSSSYPPITLLSNVTNFDLNYLMRNMGSTATTPFVLASPGTTLLGTAQSQNIDANHWVSQYFTPVLPLGATSYTITSAQINMQASGSANGCVLVCIASANASKQPATYLESEPLYAPGLSTSLEYATVQFTNLKSLSLATYPGLCLVIKYNFGSGSVANLQYETSLLNILSGAYWSTTSNAGSTWTSASGFSCLQFNVNGATP